MQRIILLVVRSSTVAIVVGRIARVYSSLGEYLSLAPSSGELLAREALLLVTGPVLQRSGNFHATTAPGIRPAKSALHHYTRECVWQFVKV